MSFVFVFFLSFLEAIAHLCTRLCPSVDLSIGPFDPCYIHTMKNVFLMVEKKQRSTKKNDTLYDKEVVAFDVPSLSWFFRKFCFISCLSKKKPVALENDKKTGDGWCQPVLRPVWNRRFLGLVYKRFVIEEGKTFGQIGQKTHSR